LRQLIDRQDILRLLDLILLPATVPVILLFFLLPIFIFELLLITTPFDLDLPAAVHLLASSRLLRILLVLLLLDV
jgi:hypothetical protein